MSVRAALRLTKWANRSSNSRLLWRDDSNIRCFRTGAWLQRNKQSVSSNFKIGPKKNRTTLVEAAHQDEINDFSLDDVEYESIVSNFMRFSRESKDQRVVLIQPYIKWGPKKSATTPEMLVEESQSLVHSLPNWTVVESINVPLESLDKKYLFGKGKLEELKTAVREQKMVTCLFISKSTLTVTQKQVLEKEFRLPILDRYSMVVQILRSHATTMEAKIQVAMAELPYIWTQMRDTAGLLNTYGNVVLSDSQKELLRNREKKLKTALKEVRQHRELLRKKRVSRKIPVIAVVGYTNAGKTSLIKALTNEQTMVPRDQLFATLDVTAHAGCLPSQMQVIYMDTVGFMADLPTGLIECFVATLEDAILADLIVHVYDVSHPNCENQKRHVESTLRALYETHFRADEPFDEYFANRIINVGNKMDKLENGDHGKVAEKIQNDDTMLLLSSKTKVGCAELLARVQERILDVTNCLEMTFRVPMGGPAAAWLFKNATIVEADADPDDSQQLLMTAIILEEMYLKFRHTYCIEAVIKS